MATCGRAECTNPVRHPRTYCSRACSHSAAPRRKRKCADGVSICSKTDCDCNGRKLQLNRQQRFDKLVESWKNGERSGVHANGSVTYWARMHLYERSNRSCEVCGWDEVHPVTGLPVICVDHVDGDRMNGRYENFKVLCPNHHAMTTTFGGLNTPAGKAKWSVSNSPVV